MLQLFTPGERVFSADLGFYPGYHGTVRKCEQTTDIGPEGFPSGWIISVDLEVMGMLPEGGEFNHSHKCLFDAIALVSLEKPLTENARRILHSLQETEERLPCPV